MHDEAIFTQEEAESLQEFLANVCAFLTSRDEMNAAIHCEDVRYSPLTIQASDAIVSLGLAMGRSRQEDDDPLAELKAWLDTRNRSCHTDDEELCFTEDGTDQEDECLCRDCPACLEERIILEPGQAVVVGVDEFERIRLSPGDVIRVVVTACHDDPDEA